MKSFILGKISVLTFLSLTSISLASPLPGPFPTQRRVNPPATSTPNVYSSVPRVQLPRITGAIISGSSHVISLAGNGMSLTSVDIALPGQMENFSGVTVQNKSGTNIPAQISKQGGNLMINFDSPLPAGSAFAISLNNVLMRTTGGERLPYQVRVTQTGAIGDISIGTALIDVPIRN